MAKSNSNALENQNPQVFHLVDLSKPYAYIYMYVRMGSSERKTEHRKTRRVF